MAVVLVIISDWAGGISAVSVASIYGILRGNPVREISDNTPSPLNHFSLQIMFGGKKSPSNESLIR